MKRLISIMLIMVMMIMLTACTLPERPEEVEDPDPVYVTTCIEKDNFLFYQSTVDAVIGTKDVWMMVTPEGDVEIPDAIYDAAMLHDYEALCYRTADGVLDKYTSGRRATTKPEPIIEYVDREIEVEKLVYTHSVIDSDFIAEDGMFYYYVSDDIVQLVYKEGQELFIYNFLYQNNVISADQVQVNSITYFDGVYHSMIQGNGTWHDASLPNQEGNPVDFTTISEVVEFYIANYSFNEVKTDYLLLWQSIQDGDLLPPEVPGMWAEETPAEEPPEGE